MRNTLRHFGFASLLLIGGAIGGAFGSHYVRTAVAQVFGDYVFAGDVTFAGDITAAHLSTGTAAAYACFTSAGKLVNNSTTAC